MLKTARRLYWAALIFSPLAFGSVDIWSLAIMEALVGLSFFLFMADQVFHNGTFYRTPGIVAATAFPLFALAQCIPLPPVLVKWLSPATFNLYQETLGLVEPVNRMTLSIHPHQTLSEFFRYATYSVLYVLGVQLLTRRDFLIRTVNLLLWLGALLGLLAILQNFTADGKIYWFSKPFRGSPFGPYVNRNHFAGLAGMLFPVLLAMFLYNKPRVTYPGWRATIAEFISYRSANTYFLIGIGILVLGAAAFLSLSRGGIVSLCLAVCLFGVLLSMRQTDRGRGAVVLGIFLTLLFAVGWFGWDPIFKRFSDIRNPEGDIAEARIPLWKDSMAIIRDFPVTGTGFGTYTDIYKGYRTVSGGGVYSRAHNDYIDLGVEGGLIGIGIAAAFVGAVFATWRRFSRRREFYNIYLYIGALSGLVSILIHSLTDFNLHIGANGLYFIFLCALCVSAAHTRIREGLGDTYLKPVEGRLHRLAFVPVLLLLVSTLAFGGGSMAADIQFRKILVLFQEEIQDPEKEQFRRHALKAIQYSPFNSLYYTLASHAEKELGNESAATAYYSRAIRLNPANSAYLQTLADHMTEKGKPDLAKKLLEAALKRDVRNGQLAAGYALWLMEHESKEAGIQAMRRAVALTPGLTKRFINWCLEDGLLAGSEIERILPERVEPCIQYAEYLIEKGELEAAGNAYDKALTHLDREEKIQPDYFMKIHAYHLKQKNPEAALEVIRRGMEYLPDDARIRVAAAALYEKMGIHYRAVEEYEKALALNPKNAHVKKRLALLRQ